MCVATFIEAYSFWPLCISDTLMVILLVTLRETLRESRKYRNVSRYVKKYYRKQYIYALVILKMQILNNNVVKMNLIVQMHVYVVFFTKSFTILIIVTKQKT